MNSFEKYQKMLSLKPYQDRREIPVYPMILTWCGTASGIKQSELVSSNKKWLEAMDKTFRLIGKPDCSIPTSAGQAVFAMTMPAKLPGRELDDNALYQFVEKPNMTEEDYGKIQEVDCQSRAEGAHHIDGHGCAGSVGKHGEETRNQLEHRVSWRVAYFQLI